MLCQNCGNQNDPTCKFCTFCGAELKSEENSPVTPEPNYNTYNEAPQSPNQAPQDGQGFAIASLVLGILSICCCASFIGVLGIIFGVLAKNKGYKGAMATAGLICGIVGTVLWVIFFIISMFYRIVPLYLKFR